MEPADEVLVEESRARAALPLALLANVTSPSARLRFTALTGDFQIDDVYVDPFKVP